MAGQVVPLCPRLKLLLQHRDPGDKLLVLLIVDFIDQFEGLVTSLDDVRDGDL